MTDYLFSILPGDHKDRKLYFPPRTFECNLGVGTNKNKTKYEVEHFILYCMSAIEIYERTQRGLQWKIEKN